MDMLPYDPNWQALFIAEQNVILNILNNSISAIYHIGSTAIIGAYAKPVIDIAIESASYPPTSECIMALSSLGYTHEGQCGVVGRHWFWKGNPRTHHIHWCPINGEVVIKQLAFRDRVLSNPELISEYSQLKRHIANFYEIDSAEYATRKSPFIAKVLNILDT